MFDHRSPDGHLRSEPPSLVELLFRIEGRLGRIEGRQDMTLDAVREVFRKADHSHARVTRVEVSLSHLHASIASAKPPAAIPAPERRSMIEKGTAFLEALKAVLPSLCWLALLIVVGALAIQGAIAPDEAKRLLGLSALPK